MQINAHHIAEEQRYKTESLLILLMKKNFLFTFLL